MTKPVILTGLRANNDLTLGNYFGGMLPMVDMAKNRSDEFQINMFIPDLHSFTTPIDHSQLHGQIIQTAKLFVAAGLPLDNSDIHLYRQSYIPAHSELTWILDCFTGFGQLERMTQFKEKSQPTDTEKNLLRERVEDEIRKYLLDNFDKVKSLNKADIDQIAEDVYERASVQFEKEKYKKASAGLFGYPVLMAADILLYGAKYVPVGDDQTQHLEFTRDIAERMNARFGDLFTIPESVKKQHEFFGKDQGLRIMDLQNPIKKMSKSDELGKGVIFLSDSPEAAAKKIMSATTDDKAYVRTDRNNQPGITNLLEILSLLRGNTLEATAKEFEGETLYGNFKKVVAGEVKQFLEEFQAKLADVNETVVLSKLTESESIMNMQANQRLLKVQRAVGLRPKV